MTNEQYKLKFYVMGTQPSCSKAVALTGKAFDDLPSALHYRDTVSPAWHAFVVVQITNEVQTKGETT